MRNSSRSTVKISSLVDFKIGKCGREVGTKIHKEQNELVRGEKTLLNWQVAKDMSFDFRH